MIAFFLTTRDSVLTVHDDILTYMQVQRGNLWQTAIDDAKNGRIGHVPLMWLLYIPYFFRSAATVRIFSACAVIFDMTALYLLVKNNIDRYAAFLSCILFISFAYISNQHNLFVAYIIGHQIPSGLVLFSLNEFTGYYRGGRRRKKLIISALLLIAASFLYEACTAYILLFLLLGLFFNEGKPITRIKGALKDNLVNMAFLGLYVLVYMIWRVFYPSSYDGSVLSFGNIPRSLLTMMKYSFGMTPGLPAAAMHLKRYVSFDTLLDSLDIWMFIFPLIPAAAFYFLFPAIRDIRNKGFLFICCLAGILIPNIIISFTPKYTEWAAGNSYSYVTSFYSYFFLILLFILILKTLFRKKSRITLLALSGFVFVISIAAVINNTAWNCYFRGQLRRYEAFETAVSSDYFDGLEDGTVVYIPDYSGIHNDMSITESFVSIYTDTELSFTNNADALDFGKNVIMMKYDPDTGTVSCGRLEPDMTFLPEYSSE